MHSRYLKSSSHGSDSEISFVSAGDRLTTLPLRSVRQSLIKLARQGYQNRAPQLTFYSPSFSTALVQSESPTTPVSEPCQLLLNAAIVYPQCSPHGNCTGLACQQTTGGNRYTASFAVTVDLLVDAGGGSSDRQKFNGSANVTFAGSGEVAVDMRRNASRLQFEVKLS